MSSGGTIDKILDRIPGYGGYRDKERRRDSDRAIRDSLALEYGQLADRLNRLARTLADERQILAVGVVDKPHKQLQSFIDRVRTASYGYAPLFSAAPVDADALDQLAAFDRALADQQSVLAPQIADLESADPKSPEFKQLASAIQDTIQGLDDRFDKRGEVLTSGKASSDSNVLDLLNPSSPSTPPLAYRIHEGEALTFQGSNYTVVGRISAESDAGSWRAFQLRGGAEETWLLASSGDVQRVHWLTRADPPADLGVQSVSIGDHTYNLVREMHGSGDVIGQRGDAPKQQVRLLQYRSKIGDAVLNIFDWGDSQLALSGSEVDHAEIDFFTRET